MRRKEKRCTDEKLLIQFLNEAKVLHLAIPTEEAPYVLPLNYVYNDGSFFIHSAVAGYKVELLEKKPTVGFAVSEMLGIGKSANPCGTGAAYKSVVGEAIPEFIENNCLKKSVLNMTMVKYAKNTTPIEFDEDTLKKVLIIRLAITYMDFKVDLRPH